MASVKCEECGKPMPLEDSYKWMGSCYECRGMDEEIWENLTDAKKQIEETGGDTQKINDAMLDFASKHI